MVKILSLKASLIGASVAVAATGAVAFAVPASAATCTIGTSSATTGYVTCTGVSKWQVAVQCYEPVHDSYSYVYGPIVSSGRSSATCAASHGNVSNVGWRTF